MLSYNDEQAGVKNRGEYLDLIARYPQAFRNPPEPCSGIHVVTDPAVIDGIEAEMRGRLVSKGMPGQWAEVGIAYRDQYFTILRDAVYFQPGNRPGTYIRNFKPEGVSGVAILPVYRESVCMLRIFRHALRRYVLEIPRGFCEQGQTLLQNAARELKEEVGGKIRHIADLGYMNENSGLGNSKAALFYAEMEEPGASSEEEEGIQKIVYIDRHEFLFMIKKGEIDDSFTICAAARAMLAGYLQQIA